MTISLPLQERSGSLCELCTTLPAHHEYTVSPKESNSINNQVALCDTCLQALDATNKGAYWRFLEGTIWNPEPSIQALSYRILYTCKDEDWASDVLASIDLDEDTVQWAMSAFEEKEVHKDAFGNTLENGNNVILTQALDVKGTNFTASKGTIVKRIRLVSGNPEQIEGKINDQTIVILTKYVKKG